MLPRRANDTAHVRRRGHAAGGRGRSDYAAIGSKRFVDFRAAFDIDHAVMVNGHVAAGCFYLCLRGGSSRLRRKPRGSFSATRFDWPERGARRSAAVLEFGRERCIPLLPFFAKLRCRRPQLQKIAGFRDFAKNEYSECAGTRAPAAACIFWRSVQHLGEQARWQESHDGRRSLRSAWGRRR